MTRNEFVVTGWKLGRNEAMHVAANDLKMTIEEWDAWEKGLKLQAELIRDTFKTENPKIEIVYGHSFSEKEIALFYWFEMWECCGNLFGEKVYSFY